MNKKLLGKFKLFIVVALVGVFVWFLIISPMKTFRENEKKLESAARRYYELNGSQLPTGERVATVSLKQLYHKSFVEGDLFIPYTKKPCSVSNSWVKVRHENGGYRYIVYLECGVLSSNVDHKGPVIQLNGEDNMTIGLGEKFQDPGVRSVVDDSDGKLKIEDVVVKGKVDTSEIGTYELTYSAYDSLSNKSQVTRNVTVVQKLNSTLKNALNGASNFVGEPENNYIQLSNMLFRVYGLNSNNDVIVVSDEDIANVNHSKIDSWLEYYYEHLNDNVKKMIVKNKYCNMELTDTTLDTTQCNGYTKERYVYIPSVIEVNKAESNSFNFMKTDTMSWVANTKSGSKDAYLTRNYFFYEDALKSFISVNRSENLGVRPMFTIKGSTLIVDGDGSREKPYLVGDTKKAKYGSLLNERNSGEYIYDNGTLWRVIDVEEDGTTKVISINSILNYNENETFANYLTVIPGPKGTIYNPKDNASVGYYINNTATGYVDTSNLENHTIKVPLYKKSIVYGEEVETKEYKVVLSAPNMYEMFSAKPKDSEEYDYTRSYWLLNSSKENLITVGVSDNGVVFVDPLSSETQYGIRVVGYFKKNVNIVGGSGTYYDPYKIK